AEFLTVPDDPWPVYRRKGILHPYAFQRLTTWDFMESWKFNTPGIHVSGWTQRYALARIGDVLSSSGRVTAVYERKGHHYMDTDQLVVANGVTPVALVKRSMIYQARPKEA